MASTYSTAKKRNTKSKPFFAMPKEVLHSSKYATLNGWDVKLINDLGSFYNGSNNGDFSCAWVLMSSRGWRSKGTLYKSLKATIDAGFVLIARQGGRNLTSLYALTFLPIDECKGKLDINPTVRALNTWKN